GLADRPRLHARERHPTAEHDGEEAQRAERVDEQDPALPSPPAHHSSLLSRALTTRNTSSSVVLPSATLSRPSSSSVRIPRPTANFLSVLVEGCSSTSERMAASKISSSAIGTRSRN